MLEGNNSLPKHALAGFNKTAKGSSKQRAISTFLYNPQNTLLYTQ